MPRSQKPSSTNPTRLKNRFARRFVRALNNLNITKRSPDENHNIDRRSRRIKIAAYTTMASVVGSKRAWSRAVLWRVRRNRSRNGGLFVRNRRKRVSHHHKITNDHQVIRGRNPNPKREDADPFRYYSGQESKLRKLVPGAETMDSSCLMDETADYIKCLVAQVEVMKTLVDLYTNT